MNITDIIDAVKAKHIRISDHADEEAQNDELTYNEIFTSVFRGEIIEDYPNDKPYPGCLIHGQTVIGDHVHSVWGWNPENRWAVLITVYRPDPTRWINWKERRKK